MTPDSAIYEERSSPATKARPRGDAFAIAINGLVVGASVWMYLTTLGVPNVFHITGMWGLAILAALGAVLSLTKFRRSVSFVAATILIALFLIAFTPIAVAPARRLIRSDPLPPSADAVVVLSAGVTADGFLHSQGLDRLLKGLELVGSGIAPTLLVTREQRVDDDRKVTGARDQYRLAALAGVKTVMSTPLAASTHDEAIAVARIARMNRWQRIVLVTSPFHSRRACATFERAGLTVSCIPSDSRDIAVHSLDVSSDRVGAFSMWIYEMAATLQYRQRGWM